MRANQGEKRNDQDLGPQNIVQCTKGHVGGGRTRARTPAHRHRRPVRKEQGAGLSRNEPQWTGPDIGGGRWLSALGIEFDRSLSGRQARQKRKTRAERTEAARAREPVDGLAAIGGRTCDRPGVLGSNSHSAGKARSPCHQDLAGENNRCYEDARHPAGKNRVRCRPHVFLRRYPRRHHVLSLRTTCSGASADAESRSLVRADLRTQGVPGSRRERSAHMTGAGKAGRCLGLIGGLGPGATVHYYQGLLATHAAAESVPRLLIAHADLDEVRTFVEKDDRASLAGYLAGFVSRLAAGGAEVTAIVAVTPHICAAELTALSPLPLIDMVSVVAAELRARGLKRVALLGTRFTVESRMFGRLGVDVVMPKAEEIEQIHNTYMNVLRERSTPEEIDALRQLARTLITREHAEAVLIAGTDFSMVLNEQNAGFPAMDCADVHIRAIVKELLA